MFEDQNQPQESGGNQSPQQMPMAGSMNSEPGMPEQMQPSEPPQSAAPQPSGGIVSMPEKFMAGGQKMTGGTKETESSSGGGGRRLVIIVVIVAIVLGAITAGAYFFFNSSLNPFTGGGEPAPQQPEQPTPVENTNLPSNENVNQEPPANENTVPVSEGARERDAQRISDVTALAKALDAYYQSFNAYPQFLSLIPEDILSEIPTDPSTDVAYSYNVQTGRQSYKIVFEIEESAEFMGQTLTADTYELAPDDFVSGSENSNASDPTPPANTNTGRGEAGPLNLDADGDGLTLAEERLFKTSATSDDTDSDGYGDAQEINNNFNPTQSGAVTLLQAGLVKEYVNDNQGYSLLYPATWIVSPVDNGAQLLITAPSGEDVTITVESNQQNYTSFDYYVNEVSGDGDESKVDIITALGAEGVRTPDGLEVYVAASNRIFTIIYDVNSALTVNFPTVFNYLIQNLTLTQ